MEKSKIDRINELARIAKVRPLTPDELAEQQALRQAYLLEFRTKLRAGDTKNAPPKK
ncbi:MAG: DUF896 domain-containing protein [Clostridia bacterium]|nr:DUF896 domain-containing protein [Clostridia bacterium]